jgi:membrane-associated phospholipid phosphatase
MVGRPRPAGLLPGTRTRGRDAAGLGYLSGHAGVAVALCAAALPRLGPAGRVLVLACVPAVGLTRIYVGAHLPLDVVGGAALGLAVEAAVALVGDAAARPTAVGGAPAGPGTHQRQPFGIINP